MEVGGCTETIAYNKGGPQGQLLHGQRSMGGRRTRVDVTGFGTTFTVMNSHDIGEDIAVSVGGWIGSIIIRGGIGLGWLFTFLCLLTSGAGIQ
jgi:hypothetical protein